MSPPKRLRLGTRRSDLAMAQSRIVATALEQLPSHPEVELVPIITRGDRERGPLAEIGGKGLFTQELEAGLRGGDLDLAVHSLKDLPAVVAEDLTLAAFPQRGPCWDVLVSDVASSVDELPEGATVLTGSLRRGGLLVTQRPDLQIVGLRGNVATRLRRWRESGAAGLVLAGAGLERLGYTDTDVPAHRLDPESFLPAPGQGTLVVQTLRDGEAEALCRQIDHPETATASTAERHVVRAFGADCRLPLAAWARRDGDAWNVSAWLGTADGARSLRADARHADATEAAEDCVRRLREQGAEELLPDLLP